jgi:hypothetical protein
LEHSSFPNFAVAASTSKDLGEWVIKQKLIALTLIAFGLLIRVWVAHYRFLNPDEALHYALAAQSSLARAHQASLTTVHPPLYILALHEWEWLGQSELFLRLLSVCAGVGFCWVMYRWVCEVQDRGTALVCSALLLFLPSVVALSAEVRQYALLLLFSSGALYFLDRAVEQNYWLAMLFSAVSLWLALLTHYSAFIFALALGIYALMRLLSSGAGRSVLGTWAAGQMVAVGIGAFLYATHISRIDSAEMAQGIADSWLREWFFHGGADQLPHFFFHNTIRLFRYLFSHGTIGVLALGLVIVGLMWLLKKSTPPASRKPKGFELAVLFATPFVLVFAAAVSGKYPYGGTRHDAFLAIFIVPAASIGLRHLPGGKVLQTALLAMGLVVANVFSVREPPNIPLKDQKRANMTQAIEYLRSTVPPRSVIFADHSAGLLLSYYLCHHTVIPFQPLAEEFSNSDCDGYKLITPARQPWGFESSTLSAQLKSIPESYGLAPGSVVWLVQAGWINSHSPEWLSALRRNGCPGPRRFGDNILVCMVETPHRNPLATCSIFTLLYAESLHVRMPLMSA